MVEIPGRTPNPGIPRASKHLCQEAAWRFSVIMRFTGSGTE
jgi:hypothetical protein